VHPAAERPIRRGRGDQPLGRAVFDRSGQVRTDALAIRELAERVPVVAFVNNHFAGYAPQTVAQLLAALEGTGPADCC
jgi:hypothetical protein